MRYNTYINNVKCLEWGLNASQGALFDLINQAQSWASEEIVDNEVFYFISRGKVLTELPLFFSTRDTIYRNLKALEDAKVIKYIKVGQKDCVRLTEKGKSWNSDLSPTFDENSGLSPTKLGINSEKTSGLTPTYNNTNNNTTSIIQKSRVTKIPFEVFYEWYPRKAGRGLAEKTWGKLTKSIQEEVIEVVVSGNFLVYMEGKVTERGDFRPHASTWLNAMGWKDEMEDASEEVTEYKGDLF